MFSLAEQTIQPFLEMSGVSTKDNFLARFYNLGLLWK